MKNAIIILGNYSPEPSSVANCMNPLINRLSETYMVDIITDRKRNDIPEFERNNNISIYRVDDYRVMNTVYSNEMNSISSSYFLRRLTKLFTNILKIAYYVRYVMLAKEQGTGGWELNKVLKKIINLNKKRNYDIVISASQPFQSHYIAEKFKNIRGTSLKWIVFEFDPYTFNGGIRAGKIRREKMCLDEKRILDKCDIICLTPELYEYYKRRDYIKLSSKVNILPFANLEALEYDSTRVSNNFMMESKINCLFTGRLYSDIRNPECLLDVFSELDDRIHLSMMTNFSVSDIKNYTPKDYMPSVIPYQNIDTARYNLLCADILVNIGNTVEHQVPGKIFEYMSTGKPIIHFSKIKNDPALTYLRKYPSLLVINEWEYSKKRCIDQIEIFCKDCHNKKLTFENVYESLGEYSGKAVQEKFLNIINTDLGDR